VNGAELVELVMNLVEDKGFVVIGRVVSDDVEHSRGSQKVDNLNSESVV
jgi:hypothetical protein